MAYSQDLRERVVKAIQRGDRSQAQVAQDFAVSLSFVEELWRRYRETGRCAIKAWHHGPRAKLADQEAALRAAVAAQPDATLADLCEQVPAADGSRVSESALSRALRRLKITRKKRASTPVSRTRSG
jgi:putative transposase